MSGLCMLWDRELTVFIFYIVFDSYGSRYSSVLYAANNF